MTILRSFALLLCAVSLTACEKNAVQDITGSLPESRIKFFNFGVNAPPVNFYANEAKMTAVNSATGVESRFGVSYGGVGSGGFYGAVDPGQYTLSGRIADTTDKDLPISSVVGDLAANGAYSYYQSGFYNTATKTVDGFIIADEFPEEIDYSVALVRFVNAISNSSPMTLYATDRESNVETPLGSAVAYKSGGAFTPLPTGVYNLSARTAGSATSAIARTGVSFIAGRVYTIGARGDITVTSTTATNRPFLDNTANR